MENSNHKKALLVLLLVWLVVTFALIRATYAKYITSLGTSADIELSSWKLSVNDTDILENKDFTENFALVFPESEYSVEGVIVPGAVGYFDINVDSSATNVPFRTTIKSEITISDKVDENFIVTEYTINGSEVKHLVTNPYDSVDEIPAHPIPFTITDIVQKDTDKTSYRVYLTWIDRSAETGEGNGSLGYAGDMLDLKVTVTFEQIVLEETTPENNETTDEGSENSSTEENTIDNETE